ncbi:MAG: hypothetical protein U0520_00160 [Candidatus Saccharimonadales bacterium]
MYRPSATYEFAQIDEPLEIEPTVFRSSVFGQDEPYSDALINSLSFSKGAFKPETILYVEGRNYFVDLQDRARGVYDTLQVSGAGYIQPSQARNAHNGLIITTAATGVQVIQPPQPYHDGSALYAHITDYYDPSEESLLRKVVDHSPMGGYAHDLAIRKWVHMRKAERLFADSNVLVPLCQGYVDFPQVVDQLGESQRGIISLVPNKGNRLNRDLTPLLGYVDSPSKAGRYYSDIVAKKMYATGLAAATVHASGLVHNQLTAGNVDPSFTRQDGSDVVFVADWETPTEIIPEDDLQMRALDVMKTIRSLTSIAIRAAEMGNAGFWSGLAAQQAIDILCGYNNIESFDFKEDTIERISQVIDGGSRAGVMATASFLA